MGCEDLEGNALNVYAYVAKEGKPVGTRDVLRGAALSSSSVAHRHLQKLEAMGLIEKNAYGNYTLREKTKVNGYVWVGRTLVPRQLFYSFFFMGAFGAEVAIVFLSFLFWGLLIETSFLFLTGMTCVAMVLFLFEANSQARKLKPKSVAVSDEQELD